MLLVCFCSYSNANETQPATVAPAQSETSPNLIDNNNWNGATYGADPGGCCSSISGGGALYDTTTNTIMFGYGRDVLAQTIAINEALKLSGVEVDGYNYGWTWRTISNNGRGGDTLQFEVTVKDAAGNEVERYVYDYSSANHMMNFWYTESGTETFAQSYLDPQNISLSIIGKDGGFWGGYYGPEVRDVSLTLNYSANPCAADPLFDPSCDGYAETYANKLLEEQLAAQQEAALATPEVQSSVETTPIETIVATSPVPVQLGGTEDTGASPESTGQLTVQEKRDSDDDKKQKLDLVRSLDAANNFDLSSVTGGPTEDPLAMDVIEQAIGGVLNDLENTESQTIDGMGSIQTQAQGSVASNQTNTESRQERRERLKEITENRANEIAKESQEAEDMDEQSKQQMEQLALMNYVAGFDTYQTTIPGGYYPDVEFYKPTTVPESRKGLRNGLAQQLLHEQMIDMQYRRER